MLRRLSLLLTLAYAASTTRAHFPFVVPDPGATTAQMIFSETLVPEAEVDVNRIADARLHLRAADGKDVPLKLSKGEHLYTLDTPGKGTRVIRGVVDLGVMQFGKSPTNHLVYHPKTILGDAFDPKTVGQGDAPVEIVPVKAANGFKLRVVAKGDSVGKKAIRVITPDGTQDDYDLDADGLTERFDQPGRYAAWARHWVAKPGELAGKSYEQKRHYATIVFDVAEAAQVGPVPIPTTAPTTAAALLPVEMLAPLPRPVASFGAVASGGHLYVYGGHVAEMHEYSTAAVSNVLSRTSLAAPGKWETLAAAPGVQGMNLAAHGEKIYRVGGMMPRNAPGEPEDNVSIADAARFDPATGKWEALPPLPTPRSSHDVAIVGEKLYVMGGWNMRGKDKESVWLDTTDVLDFSQSKLEWKSIKQPFTRRALIIATQGDRLFAIGGMDASDDLHTTVDILDTRAGTWSKGPAIPGKPMNGFSPAATAVDGRVYLSVASGELFRLTLDGSFWEVVALTTPRIVHRLVPDGPRILIVGGAAKGKMLNTIESVTVTERP